VNDVSAWLRAKLGVVIAAAATLTGKRFALLVASSLVATTAIVFASASSHSQASPLATVLGHKLAADRVAPPAAVTPIEAEPEPEEEAPEPVVHHHSSPAPEPASSALPEPEPVVVPEETAPPPAEEETPPPEEEPPAEEEAPAPPPKPEAGRIKHIFVVSVLSPGYQAAFGKKSQMPYLSGTLRPQGMLLSNYSVLDKATTPNGIAAISGQPPNKKTKEECPTFSEFPPTSESHKGVVSGEGCVYPVETLTLSDQLPQGGFSSKAYMEGMVSPTTGEAENCVHPGPEETEAPALGGYSARFNPFTHFHSLLDLGACATEDVPIPELKKDLKSEATTPNYVYVAPDLCSAGALGQCPEGAPQGAAASDEWLAEVVPEIVESKAFKKDGLLIVTFTGVEPAPPAEGVATKPEPKPLKTGALLVSQFTQAGGTDPAPYTPYSLLRSSEELFGLGQLAKAGDPKTKTFAPALLGENGGD
jgi:phosphatidylinositol-3-phosphatase